MSRRKTPKTTGLEWLEHSIANFNGTRYCDRSSDTAFLASYCAYKTSKLDADAILLAQKYHNAILPLCAELASREYEQPDMITDKQRKYLWVLEEKLGRKHRDHSSRTKKSAMNKIKKLLEVLEK
jgi:hypothetical protein